MCDAHGPFIVDEGALLTVDVSAVMASGVCVSKYVTQGDCDGSV